MDLKDQLKNLFPEHVPVKSIESTDTSKEI